MTIYKIILPTPGQRQTYSFPENARPLTAQMQYPDKVAWIQLEETRGIALYDFEFILVGTGWKLDTILQPDHIYLSTIQEYQYIWHVFYRIIKGENK